MYVYLHHVCNNLRLLSSLKAIKLDSLAGLACVGHGMMVL